MSPITHLLASWIVAAKTTDNLRDRRLVTLAGVAPDLDGLGIILDIANGSFARGHLYYYPQYHHWLMHGLPAALVCSAVLAAFGRRRWHVFALAFVVFHLHLLCDLVGSRGPEATDLWPIFYFAPLSQHPMWIWKHQWGLDSWPNRLITVTLFGGRFGWRSRAATHLSAFSTGGLTGYLSACCASGVQRPGSPRKWV